MSWEAKVWEIHAGPVGSKHWKNSTLPWENLLYEVTMRAEFASKIKTLVAIDRECFDHGRWDAEAFLGSFPMKWDLSRLLKVEGKVVGYCVASAAIPNLAHLHRLAVAPAYRNCGCGAGSLRAMEADAVRIGLQAVTLELDGSEGDYEGFYARHGYKLAGAEDRAAYARRKEKTMPENRRLMFKLFGQPGNLSPILAALL